MSHPYFHAHSKSHIIDYHSEKSSAKVGNQTKTIRVSARQGIVSRSMAQPLNLSKRIRLYVNGDKHKLAGSSFAFEFEPVRSQGSYLQVRYNIHF